MSKIIDKISNRINKYVEKIRPKWSHLTDEEIALAQKIVAYVEQVGGRDNASKIMRCSVSSIDNYRSGATKPDAITYSLLESEAAQNMAQHINEVIDPLEKSKVEIGQQLQALSQSKSSISNTPKLNKDVSNDDFINIARQLLRDITQASDPDLFQYDPEEFANTFADILKHRMEVGDQKEKISNIVEFQAARFSRR